MRSTAYKQLSPGGMGGLPPHRRTTLERISHITLHQHMPITPPTIPSLFITATSTDVGKTLVACAIADYLTRSGYKVAPLKPFATGCRSVKGNLVADDALALAQAARAEHIPHETICPIRLRTPAAPIEALRAEKNTTRCSLAPINRSIKHLCASADLLLIEGVGGVEVPLCSAISMGLKHAAPPPPLPPGGEGKRAQHARVRGPSTSPHNPPATVIHLIRALNCPALIVADASLATINHTVLTIRALQHARIPIAGVVLNRASTKRADPTIQTNARWITKMTAVPVLASFPTLPPSRAPFNPARIPPSIRRAADQLNPAKLFA